MRFGPGVGVLLVSYQMIFSYETSAAASFWTFPSLHDASKRSLCRIEARCN